jgi:HJR/Mrr/RecB family endonuclease
MPSGRRRRTTLLGEIWSLAVIMTLLWAFTVGPNAVALFNPTALKVSPLGMFGVTTKEGVWLVYWATTLITLGLWVSIGLILVSRRNQRLREIEQSRNRRQREIEQARTISQMQALVPEHFEELVADMFRKKGYSSTVTPHQGDHGIDIVLRAPNGEKEVVQCKRYIGQVGEPVVRDFYGALLHENAVRGYIVTTGSFTYQAVTWARGKPIELIEGQQLSRMVQSAPASLTAAQPTNPSSQSPVVPQCPKCGAPMVLRTAHKGAYAGRTFYGCSNYPRCRGIVNVVHHQ